MATIAATKQAVIDQINAKAGTATSKDTIFLAKALKEASNAIDVGTNGQVLKTNAAATGVEWATDGGLPTGGSTGQVVTNTTAGVGTWQDSAVGGKVLNIWTTNSTGRVSSSNNVNSTFRNQSNMPHVGVDIITINITPSSTTSKLIIQGHSWSGNPGNGYASCGLYSNTTSLSAGYNNGYGSDGGTLSVYATVPSNITTGVRTIRFTLNGMDNGSTCYTGSYRSSDYLYMGYNNASGYLTITEVEV
jgi:hypothetical protein